MRTPEEIEEFERRAARRTALALLWGAAAGVALGLLSWTAFSPTLAEETPPPALEQPLAEKGEPPLPDPCPDGSEVLAAQTPADQELQARVQGALDTAKLERLTKVEVVAVGKIVCLRGTAANPTDRKRAETIADEIEGVGQVVNKLTIPLATLGSAR
jgi:hypothetical protein